FGLERNDVNISAFGLLKPVIIYLFITVIQCCRSLQFFETILVGSNRYASRISPSMPLSMR
ncbi:MAG: hypothetical protein ACTSRA_22445, partial [Promethearchaeota archaeon]